MCSRTLWLAALVLVGCGPRDGMAVNDAPLEVVIDTRAPTRPISPYVYGINGLEHASEPGVHTLIRLGGTRYSTYNWENNASNAGHDPPANQNDGYLCDSTEPGAAIVRGLERTQAIGAALLVTVPMCGHVARDRRGDGDVARSPDHLRTRFVRSVARGGRDGAPDPNDDVVHQDAFVRFVRREARARGVPVFFALDNEPGSWPVTIPRVRAERPATYRELVASSIEHAAMIQDEAPEARVFGPVSFGWPDMRDLAGAPDAGERHFLQHYLERMRDEHRRRGKRLLDVLDVHWYPDVHVEGVPVTAPSDEPAVARMRMHLPRSLYDAGFREPSWIVNDDLREPVQLLSRLTNLTKTHYRDTLLAISEYAYGGGAQPSGAVAQADALGALGAHGAFAAAYWPLTNQEHTYALAAFRMYRRIDGEVSFGDRSLPATSTDLARVSAWASLDSQHPGRLVIVLVARVDQPTELRLIAHGATPSPARRFVLDAASTTPRAEGTLTPDARGTYVVPIPARSVTTLIVEPESSSSPR